MFTTTLYSHSQIQTLVDSLQDRSWQTDRMHLITTNNTWLKQSPLLVKILERVVQPRETENYPENGILLDSSTHRAVMNIQYQLAASMLNHFSRSRQTSSSTEACISDDNDDLCLQHISQFSDSAQPDFLGRTVAHVAGFLGHKEIFQLVCRTYTICDSEQDAFGLTAWDYWLTSRGAFARTKPNPTNASGNEVTFDHITNSGSGWSTSAVIPKLLRTLLPPQYITPRASRVCHFDVISGIPTLEVLHQNYILQGRPLLMAGAAKNWKVREMWVMDSLVKAAGNAWVSVNTVPYGTHYGGPQTITMPLAKYLKQEEDARTLKKQCLGSFSESDCSKIIGAPKYVFHKVEQSQEIPGLGDAIQRLLSEIGTTDHTSGDL